jgi:serine/threonine-protein phosphatase PGAM5
MKSHSPSICSAIVIFCLIVIGAGLCQPLNTAAALQHDAGEQLSGVRTLYLIRHGQYDEQDERDPDVGKGLVPLGVAQARLVAARLRSFPVKMTSLHSSTMTRARQTALVIGESFPGLQLQTSKLLRECTPTTWRKDIMAQEDPAYVEACEKQLDEAFAKYFVPSPGADSNDIIVCHGNMIRYFVTKVLGVDTKSWLMMAIGNCSLTIVRIKPDGSMKLLTFGDVGHMPPNMQTGLYNDTKDLIPPE